MIRTEIELLEAPDPVTTVPSFLKSAGLTRRMAVIQHTHRPDSVDMCFDEPLFLRLLEFALQFGSNHEDHEVGIIDRGPTVNRDWEAGTAQEPVRADEIDPDVFCSEWNASEDPYRFPPEFIVVRQNGNMVLCIVTEHWAQVGGPEPYADSYTYSIIAKEDIAGTVTEFLRESDMAPGWELSIVPSS